MKKIKLLVLALAIITAVLPFNAFCQEETNWQYDFKTGVVEYEGTKYVHFDTMEYEVAIGDRIGKAVENDSYGDYFIYGVKNVKDNDLVFLYNYCNTYNYGEECYCYYYSSFAMLYCKEDKVPEYTEKINNFKASDKYCISENGCVAADVDNGFFEEISRAEETEVPFNNTLYEKYFQRNNSKISVYDSEQLFYTQIGTVYQNTENEQEIYFCDYREMENVDFTLGVEPELSFRAVAKFKDISENVYPYIENAENQINDRMAAIEEECMPEDTSVLVSSSSVADFAVMVAVVILLLLLPLFIIVLSIIKLTSKKTSKRLWITMMVIAVIVIAITTTLMIIII